MNMSLINLYPNELIIDSFAGGGGASLAIEMALGRGPDIAINHDSEAIAMHQVNHPHTEHYCESVWDVSPLKATRGKPVGLAWFSPDCKHFSKAKGGKPVDKAIRGLAWVVIRWARDVRPRMIFLENVEEFKTWGPIGSDNKPCPHRKGRTFKRWVNELKSLGYNVEYRELRACDYGAPTIRKRLFIVARRDGLPIVWPEPSHGPGTKNEYKTAAECIDWSIKCPSIFERKRPLAENTLKRIARGIKRYVVDSPNPFIVQIAQTGGKGSGGVRSVDEPLSTIVSKAEHCVVSPTLVSAFLAKHYGGVVGSEIEKPIGTITSIDHHSLVTCHMNDARSNAKATAKNHVSEVRAFLIKYNGVEGSPLLTEPLHTVTTKDRFGLVQVSGQKYELSDIGLRMLSPRELFTAQGFPEAYQIDIVHQGKKLSKAAQVRMCGNSVSPPVGAALILANVGATKSMGPDLDSWEPGLVKSGEQMSLFDLDQFMQEAS